MTTATTTDRFFLDFTFGEGEHKQTVAVWIEDAPTEPQELLEHLADVIHAVSGGLVGTPSLVLAVERDERTHPCPECRDGEVENVGREERETGHQPYACNASCGYYG